MIEFCLSNSSFFYRYRCFDEWCSISANKAGAKGENRNNFNELRRNIENYPKDKYSHGKIKSSKIIQMQILQVLMEK